MYPGILSRILLPLPHVFVVQSSHLHSTATSYAAVKKTTSAAGGKRVRVSSIRSTITPSHLARLGIMNDPGYHCGSDFCGLNHILFSCTLYYCSSCRFKMPSARARMKSIGVMGLGKGKKKAGKLSTMEKKEMPVETDPEKLINYVCGSNIYTTGEDVKIKEDSQYPEWLWSLNTGGAPPLDQLDPTTKQYWLRVRAAGMRRNNKLRSMRKF